MMVKINIKESSTIQPAQDTPKEPLWISNIDRVMMRVHTPRVFIYRSTTTNGPSTNILNAQDLKESLTKALVLFYPLSGRLGYDINGRIEIKCNAKGALFVEAETDSTLDDLNDFTPSSELSQLLPKIDYSTDLSSYPLLLSQVTYFKCGGIALGVGLHHILADGASTLNFVNTWASITRGISSSITPLHDRTLLRARVPPSPTFHHIEYDPSPTMNNGASHSEPVATAIFVITFEQLKTLKSKSRKNEQNENCFTTYEVLAAHIWRCTCKARGLADDQETKLYMPFDGRSKMNPPLPSRYFGNVVFHATIIALSGDLQSESLMDTVERVHKALKRMDDEYLRSAIDYIEMQPDLSCVARGRHTYSSPNLNINKWSRFPVQDANFGCGPPVFMGLARASCEGIMFLLPNTTDDGSSWLSVCLKTRHMQLFKKCLYDFD